MPAAVDPDPLDLDGREFVLVSSTASDIDPAGPTRFVYRERDGVVWGGYAGDTVVVGRFVGTREAAALAVSFVHRTVAGAVVRGDAASTIEQGPAGLRLVERFEVEGVPQTSVCEERAPHPAGGSATLL